MQRLSVSGILTALGGLALLVAVVWRVGLPAIAADVRQVGWGLPAVIVMGGLRFLLRAQAWRLCLEPPYGLTSGAAFSAVICGDTIGNLTPLGPIVGEPAKAAIVRRRVPLAPALTALAIENVVYTLSAAAMVATGMIALLARFRVPEAVRDVGLLAVAATIGLFVAALTLAWRRPALVSRWLHVAPRLARHADRVRAVEDELYSFATRRPGRLAMLATAELGFHALGVAEAYLTLWLIDGTAPPLMTAFLFETANRLLTVVFKFVPLRLGVDQAGTAVFATLIGIAATTGTSLAIVRQVRVLFWALAGGLVLVREGLSSSDRR